MVDCATINSFFSGRNLSLYEGDSDADSHSTGGHSTSGTSDSSDRRKNEIHTQGSAMFKVIILTSIILFHKNFSNSFTISNTIECSHEHTTYIILCVLPTVILLNSF